MKKASSARRVPRRVGHDEDEAAAAVATPEADDGSEATIKRPAFKPRKSAANLRPSFGPSADEEDGAGEAASVVTPKRSALSRVAIQRNASKRSSLLAKTLPTRQVDEEEDRPSYSAASLQALKASTPSTPRDLDMTVTDDDTSIQDMEQSTQALDLTSKFGSSLARYQQASAIPSAAEIAEKKERRARAAKEQQAEEYISLDPDDPGLDDDDEDADPNVTRDEQGRLILKPVDKYSAAESRLVREDEDIMEGFDAFTEDGQVHLGRAAELAAARKRKVDMAAQIASAEGEASDAENSDASERGRNAAFEAAQTRHGTYGTTHHNTTSSTSDHPRPKAPSVISPLPTLDSVLERLRRQLDAMQSTRARKLQEMAALRREKVRLAGEEVRIQRALRETAEKFRVLRGERGISGAGASGVEGVAAGLGVAAVARSGDGEGEGVDVDVDIDVDVDGQGDAEAVEEGEQKQNVGSAADLGSRALRAQDGWSGAMNAAPGLGMARPPADEDDW
ncbi:hypothetical protein LTR08_005348 [Meristemomyces frigidus]|nr:hypothetical protein LTR08_005348 [Meristemomyces frigidus]